MNKSTLYTLLHVALVSFPLCRLNSGDFEVKVLCADVSAEKSDKQNSNYDVSLPWKSSTISFRKSTYRLAFLDSGCLISGDNKGILRLWDVMGQKCMRIIHSDYEERAIEALEPLPGSRIAVGQRCKDVASGGLGIYDPRGTCLYGVYNRSWGGVNALAVLPNNRLVYSVEKGDSEESTSSLVVFDVEKKRAEHTISGGSEIVSLAACPSSPSIFASGDNGGMVCILDIRKGSAPFINLDGHTKSLCALTFLDENYIVSADTGTIKIWDLRKCDIFSTWNRKTEGFISTLVRITSTIFAVGKGENIIFCDRVKSCELPNRISSVADYNGLGDLVYDEQNYLASAGLRGCISLWRQHRKKICFSDPRDARHDQIRFYYKKYKDNPEAIPPSRQATSLQKRAVYGLRHEPEFLFDDNM